jgi:hypothetical protein
MPSDQSPEKNENSPRQFPQNVGEEIELFFTQIDALADTLPLATLAVQRVRANSLKEFLEFTLQDCTVVSKAEGKVTYTFESGNYWKFQRLQRRLKKGQLAQELVPRGLLVAMVSQFDAYVGGLLRQLFMLKPEIIEASENTLTISQLMECGSIDSARAYVMDKQIDAVLRKSHSEQFDWLEGKFGLTLRENLQVWPVFIEVTERRNLFVHANGVISHQYLETCRKHSSQIPPKAALGVQLPLTLDYFAAAHECLVEIGVKLGQVLWRKVAPSEMDQADQNLIRLTYELLTEGRYVLARVLLDFATTTLRHHSSEEYRLTLIVNRVQAYKWSGDSKRAREILDSIDWTATALKFKLAHAVLRDEFQEASEIVKKIGQAGDVRKHDYREWPLFKNLRTSTEFASAFENVFGEPLNNITVRENESEIPALSTAKQVN